MPPHLAKITLNGASRHRLRKGFILLDEHWTLVDAVTSRQVIQEAQKKIEKQGLTGWMIEPVPEQPSSEHPAILHLVTPFLPVSTPEQRDQMIKSLAQATAYIVQASEQRKCRLTAAGVNPYQEDGDEGPHALCADLHQIEVYDAGESERIYNFFRYSLAELLALSTHSAVYGGVVQNDCSLRMRENQVSFLPHYISEFSEQHLDQLQNMVRREYGLPNLHQMDIDPLAGESLQCPPPLLDKKAAAIELRFVDAQCSYAFIRAQIILFQAITIRAREKARWGGRVYYLRDKVLDQNKALAMQNGLSAIFKPDPNVKRKEGRRLYSYHERGEVETATTALLTFIKRELLYALRSLSCKPREIMPILLGLELRQDNLRCFANYAEYQQYLCHTYRENFNDILYEQGKQMLMTPSLDMISYYNQDLYKNLIGRIEQRWEYDLKPHNHQARGQHTVRPASRDHHRGPQERNR